MHMLYLVLHNIYFKALVIILQNFRYKSTHKRKESLANLYLQLKYIS